MENEVKVQYSLKEFLQFCTFFNRNITFYDTHIT